MYAPCKFNTTISDENEKWLNERQKKQQQQQNERIDNERCSRTEKMKMAFGEPVALVCVFDN